MKVIGLVFGFLVSLELGFDLQMISSCKWLVRGERGAYGVLLVESARKRLLGIPRRRWEDNIKINLKEIPVGHGPKLSDSE
jgi:hypothetical protein